MSPSPSRISPPLLLLFCLVGPALANSQYRRAQAPKAVVHWTSSSTVRVSFPGYTTVAVQGSKALAYTGAGLGLTTAGKNLIQEVKDVELTDRITGQALPQFDFNETTRVADEFKLKKAAEWSGWQAVIGADIQANMPVSYTFILELKATTTESQLNAALKAGWIGTGETDKDGKLTGKHQHIFAPFAVEAPGFLHYRFVAGAGPKAINYMSGIAPVEGTMQGNQSSPWVAGRFGSGLRGGDAFGKHSFVDTGWSGGFYGSFSVGFFVKRRFDHSQSLSYFFSGAGDFRCFTGGAAGKGIWCRGWGGNPLGLAYDVRSGSNGKWVHIALSVDHLAKKAIWYVDGIARSTITITKPAFVPASSASFKIGMHVSTTSASFYDIDEFILANRVASQAEIKQWAENRAADGMFGRGCIASLSSENGAPKLGNVGYRYLLEAPPSSPYVISLGITRLKLFGVVNLPLDLGTLFFGFQGCMLESSLLLTPGGLTDANGVGKLTLPLAASLTFLDGVTLYNQALVLDQNSFLALSNPFASTIAVK